MIVRRWSARTSKAQSKDYLRNFQEAVLPALRKYDGYTSSNVLTRPKSDEIEIVVLTAWNSLTAIDAFAGPDREAAVVAPEAAALLAGYDRRVRHFEVAIAGGIFARRVPVISPPGGEMSRQSALNNHVQTATFLPPTCLHEYEVQAAHLRDRFPASSGMSCARASNRLPFL